MLYAIRVADIPKFIIAVAIGGILLEGLIELWKATGGYRNGFSTHFSSVLAFPASLPVTLFGKSHVLHGRRIRSGVVGSVLHDTELRARWNYEPKSRI